jgi:hypothetical protein
VARHRPGVCSGADRGQTARSAAQCVKHWVELVRSRRSAAASPPGWLTRTRDTSPGRLAAEMEPASAHRAPGASGRDDGTTQALQVPSGLAARQTIRAADPTESPPITGCGTLLSLCRFFHRRSRVHRATGMTCTCEPGTTATDLLALTCVRAATGDRMGRPPVTATRAPEM